jgi:hypothetical protein
MKTKLVTAFYTDIKGFPFFGHETYARHERYLHSLRTIANTKNEIIVYCNEGQYELLTEYCNSFNLSNVTVKISNLKDYPKADRMMEIKEKTGGFKMYHEIDWNKFFLLEKEYDETYDYIYWIDCGLSHPGLFLDKYNPYTDKVDGLSKTWENYSYVNLFNENFIPKLNEWVNHKLINCSITLFFHDMKYVSTILEKPYKGNSLSIGGILGGSVGLLKWYFQEFDFISNKCLDKDSIINHEALLSYMVFENPEKFTTWEFDTWYHDDYWKKTPQFNRDSIKNIRHFVHLFDKVLQL